MWLGKSCQGREKVTENLFEKSVSSLPGLFLVPAEGGKKRLPVV
jgi:hypothetical protein